MSCFQCDMDIPHVCYEGMPRARWGWTDEAVATLEAAQQHLLSPSQRQVQPLPEDTVRQLTKKSVQKSSRRLRRGRR